MTGRERLWALKEGGLGEVLAPVQLTVVECHRDDQAECADVLGQCGQALAHRSHCHGEPRHGEPATRCTARLLHPVISHAA